MENLERDLELAADQLSRSRIAPGGVADGTALRPHAEMANGVDILMSRSRPMRLDGRGEGQREQFHVRHAVQRHDVARRALGRERGRRRVHVRHHPRMIGALLEHHEDVHTPS
jgi:hypothetical protein